MPDNTPKKKSLVKREPVVSAAVVAGLIVTILSVFHVVVDINTVSTIITAVLPVALAVLARHHVTPVS